MQDKREIPAIVNEKIDLHVLNKFSYLIVKVSFKKPHVLALEEKLFMRTCISTPMPQSDDIM